MSARSQASGVPPVAARRTQQKSVPSSASQPLKCTWPPPPQPPQLGERRAAGPARPPKTYSQGARAARPAG
eukprot:9315167-Alexandrium_andersonii.AAC.1